MIDQGTPKCPDCNDTGLINMTNCCPCQIKPWSDKKGENNNGEGHDEVHRG
jgi:hypothetical protein